MSKIGLFGQQLGGSGGKPWQGQIQKLVITPRVRKHINEEKVRSQTALPKKKSQGVLRE